MARTKQYKRKNQKNKVNKQKTFSLDLLVTNLTKDCHIVLAREDFVEVTSNAEDTPTIEVSSRLKKGKKSKKNQLVKIWIPSVDQIVWGKMKGFASWPAKVLYI